MAKIIVYLAGAMSAFYNQGRYQDAIQWRDYARNYFSETELAVFDPTHNSKTHFAYPEEYSNGFILQNYVYLKQSDVILLNLDLFEDSIGSIWEVSTSWIEHKPVVAFGRCKLWQDRPHFKSLICVNLDTVEDACDYILSMYGQKI